MNARAIFFDPDSAETARARLVTAGYQAVLVRERLAGEDDDEDQPWALLSDAPEFVLELLTEEFEGWLDHDSDHDSEQATGPTSDLATDLLLGRGRTRPAAPAPLELPSQPRRVKRGVRGPDTLEP